MLELIDHHPVATVICIAIVVTAICHAIITTTNRVLRHRNILKHGYPPEHCDADGDFRTTRKADV